MATPILDEKNMFLLKFLLKGVAFYLSWIFLYNGLLMNSYYVDSVLINHLVKVNKVLLELFGYNVFNYGETIGIDGSHGVYIGVPCNGMSLFALFTGFIVIFKGTIKYKIPFVISGVLAIHCLNVLRIFFLTLLSKFNPELLDFNHKYTFTILIYIVIFLLWMLWVKKYASKV